MLRLAKIVLSVSVIVLTWLGYVTAVRRPEDTGSVGFDVPSEVISIIGEIRMSVNVKHENVMLVFESS